MKNNVQLYHETVREFQQQVAFLQRVAKHYNASQLTEDLQRLLQLIERDHFELIVVGEFSNGKSTFINALLREKFLPSSINPTTAMLNKIRYADEKSYDIVYMDGTRKRVTEEQFKQLVAPDSKPSLLGNLLGIEKEKKELTNIREAQLGFPTSFCRNNITIIDSPGTNDFDAAREAITTHYIPRSDAAIFLLNATKPFSESDKVFLGRILEEHLHKIFFLVNFKDLLDNEADEKTALAYIEKQLKELIPNPKMYLISAQHALLHYIGETSGGTARRRRKPLLSLEQTGMPAFEQDLDYFLAYETGMEKLVKLRAMYEEAYEKLLHEQLYHEQSMLENATRKDERQIVEIEQKLQQLQRAMYSQMDRAESQISLQTNMLKNWYYGKLTNISQLALQTLDELYDDGVDQADIKYEIERRTGRLESEIPQEINVQIRQLLAHMFGDNLKKFNAALTDIKTDVSNLKVTESASWQKEFDYYEEKESYGGFLGLLFTSVRNFFSGSRRRVDVKAKMREQVMERYSNSISAQVEQFERVITRQLHDVVVETKKMIERQINDERMRNERALKAASAKVEEREQQLHDIHTHIVDIQAGRQVLMKIIEMYVKQVNQDDM